MYQLQVSVNELNIRNTPDADPTYKNRVGSLLKGTTFYAERLVQGGIYDNSNNWYADTMNRFYWAGGVTVLQDTANNIAAPPPAAVPTKDLPNPLGNKLPVLADWSQAMAGLAAKYPGTNGENIRIGVLDSGIEVLQTDVFPNVVVRDDFTTPDVNAIDDQLNGHGTHVAGIIGADTSYKNGVIGVAPQTKLYIAKVLGNAASLPGGGQLANGLSWLQQYQPHVYNMSMGFSGDPSDALSQLLNGFVGQSSILVAAAGDDYALLPNDIYNRPQQIQYPANHEACIKVGTISQSFIKNYSQIKDRVDILCPKVLIWSCSNQKNQFYAQLSGSSMATAFISGIIARILSFKVKSGIDITTINKAQILRELSALSSPVTAFDYTNPSSFTFNLTNS